MGLFGIGGDRLFDPLDIAGDRAGDRAKDAAKIQARQFEQGLEEMRRQFGINQGNIDPFVQSGVGALPFLEQGANAEGMDQIISQIMDTGLFDDLLEERTRSVEGLLSTGGLTRSGAAIEEGERLPTDLAFTISQILQGNADQLATRGANAAVGAGSQGGQFGANAANLLGQQGNALASGILGEGQAEAQGTQNAINLASLFFNRGGTAASKPQTRSGNFSFTRGNPHR